MILEAGTLHRKSRASPASIMRTTLMYYFRTRPGKRPQQRDPSLFRHNGGKAHHSAKPRLSCLRMPP